MILCTVPFDSCTGVTSQIVAEFQSERAAHSQHFGFRIQWGTRSWLQSSTYRCRNIRPHWIQSYSCSSKTRVRWNSLHPGHSRGDSRHTHQYLYSRYQCIAGVWFGCNKMTCGGGGGGGGNPSCNARSDISEWINIGLISAIKKSCS